MTIDDRSVSGPQLDQLLLREQARLHAQTWAPAAAGSLVLGVIVAAVMSRVAPAQTIGIWFGALCLVLLGRLLVGLAQARSGVNSKADPVWVTRHRAVSLAHGMVWGLASALLFPSDNMAYQTFLALTLSGICVSSLTSYAFDLRSSLMFCVPTQLALSIVLWQRPDTVSQAMAFTVLMFIVWVALVSIRSYRAVRQNVALRGQEQIDLQALQRGHQQLAQAEQLAQMGSAQWNPQSGVLVWSDQHYRLWGLPPGSVVPDHALFMSAVHPQDRPRLEEALRLSVQSGAPYDEQFRIVVPDGDVRTIHGRGEVFQDDHGVAVRVVGTVQDITERKLAQTALADKQQLLSAMLDSTPMGFWFVDNSGVTTGVNPAMCRVLARRAVEVIGHPLVQFFDPGPAATLLQQMTVGLDERPQAVELEVRRPDGAVVQCLVNLTPVTSANGAHVGFVGMFSDLTLIERATAALRISEFVVNSVQDLVSVMDQHRVYRLVNDAWCQRLGLAREDVVGRHASEVMPLLSTPERTSAFESCLRTGLPQVLTANVDVAQLGRRCIETTLTPLLGVGTEVSGVVAVTRDITDFEASRVALAHSLENARRVFDATSDAMFACDTSDDQGRLLFANQRLFEMLDMVPALASDIQLSAIMVAMGNWFVDPQQEYRRIEEIVALDAAHEDKLVLRDGRVLQRNCVPMRAGDGPTLVWTFRDITMQERAIEVLRSSEAGQRAILDAFPGYVGVIDQNFSYVHVNTRLAYLMGFEVHEIVGRPMREVLGEARFQEVAAEVEIARRVGRAVSTRVYEATPSRARVDLQVTHVVGVDRGATNQLCYAFAIDITDRVHAENALVVAKEEAERANQAKSAFLASVSHELKTPLNAILGFSEVLRADPQMAVASSDGAAEIERAGQHLLSLVDDLIDLGRVETGHLDLSIGRVALESVINEGLSLVAPLAAKQGIRIVYSGGDARNAMVLADPVRLRQVVINLLSNAIKYNRAEGTVRVSCQRRAVAGGKRQGSLVRVSVRDTGLGISPERAAGMFSAFDRLGAERGVVEGTGIGLVITKRLVQAMGGEIGFDSNVGEGSVFWVDLALAGAARSEQPASGVVQHGSGKTSGARVLVAEDYAPNQAVLKLQLVGLGCVVDMVNDGTAALAKWSAGSYDLLLSDLDMPLMDGLELARTIRLREKTRGGRIPIIALSAAVVGAEREKCLQAGFDDLMGKPISVQGLAQVLRQWLRQADQAVDKSGQLALDLTAESGQNLTVLNLEWLYQVLGRVSATQASALVATFLDAARSGLRELARPGTQAAALVREMHRQQSSARTVGALRYAALAASVESQARSGSIEQLPDLLARLNHALHDIEQQTMGLDGSITDSAPLPLAPDSVDPLPYASVLVVDDDPVVLMQMTQMLGSIGLAEVLTARNGVEAIRLMNRRRKTLDLVVCDLNMPEMDGVEMIRRFGQSNFSGALILMSGADEQILNTVGKLAALQGLAVLGQIHKPVTPLAMRNLLRQTSAAPVDRRPARPGSALTPETIRSGMAAQQFLVWLQPKVHAQTLEPVGVEALARWRQSDGTFVPPDLFIVMAERAGIIGELSGVLVAHALADGARLHAAGYPLKISINLSALWLDDLRLPDLMSQSVKAVGLTPGDIILEVTETGVTKDVAVALDVLTRLRLKGFGLSIDDFGIGYSSFEQLGRIPFTEMKIDRSFVNRGAHDSAARAILESSMVMAQKLNLSTVAEGVETEAELELMRDLGCDGVQGYLIARPMPVSELIAWLQGRTVSS